MHQFVWSRGYRNSVSEMDVTLLSWIGGLGTLKACTELSSELRWEDDPVLPDVHDGRNLLLEHLGGDAAGEGMIDSGEVVEHEPEPRLELAPEAPRHRQRCGRVVEDITDEVETRNFARHGGAINDERGNDDVCNLRYKIVEHSSREITGEPTSPDASACSRLNAMQRAISPRRPDSARSIASKRLRASFPS